ncbi:MULTISPECIES: Asp-tRNA(Asn)/Glu-tRNA(Gln) amidotransferase subunit GatB [unclassified Oleiphilus]|uniref:Asp-tRNA(Asn)/Glu-tRNA(Gln) amidotransferase subunit GatB n=5 Tax=Oleiphilus TaxID=141450 RepID=UPI0007C3A7F9|nr:MULTISPECIES: Asp-tRNA(Asn)/Glu-tRNA(Gln) amidotransferase subunit GatB [unclassified Oleiphilus]KZY77663.1 aspartyl/glutamyl-tRNA amidotransferase subunit B [Oleiphilus sp. HI0068]KZY31139.1 aspartyl/glutamyl-tRNA amidotransferase subunit B [Oleiphilus sp. HI0043]KZZ32683.1 aspartyl/glutamyl-tRNA amidotransferase subunit B [Oleiphilus sp. HI0086]KZZ64897.1 aspartyl/glutamyl-tRNA amidotransferase subunit B [Oleiphilus sp. HI0128]KZZ74314.1 aspartyl/glutamyl-tRNA amidotransferase subunit B [
MQWETVIGLEVHVQLATKTKIFSGSSTAYGAEPNTQANEVDLALPGTLPVPNEQAFRYAVMFGLAIDAEIGKRSVFERKNYFYPDLPKGYQTTQLDLPIVGPGVVEIELEDGSKKSVRIHHAHLEEDAGKSLHEDYHGMSGIDLNRAGTPLIEIVSEPDISNSEEAVAFAKKLHSIVTSLGICDGEMSQGSMRFDVNISVRPKGQEELGTRTETKNLNSFRFMEKAIALEVERQIDILEDGGSITQETRLYDGEKDISRSMRSKEEANDYRYFPCPDLLPVELSDEFIDQIKTEMPELPDARKARFCAEYGLSSYDAGLISAQADLSHYFETASSISGDAKLSANWTMGELSARLNSDSISLKDSPISAEQLGQLVLRVKDNTLSSSGAKKVFNTLWEKSGDDVDAIIESQGLKQVSDTGALEALVDEVLAGMADQIAQYKEADDKKRKKLMGGFMGPLMKASKGQGNPKLFNQILAKKLNS